MKSHLLFSLSLSLAFGLTFSDASAKDIVLENTYKEISNTFGFVPEHMKSIPTEALPSAWEELKSIEFNDVTALSPRVKSLIGLAVASQIPCKYCIYVGKKSAKMGRATDAEIYEAIYMAAQTRHWSTFLSGAQISESNFIMDTDLVIQHFKEVKDKIAKGERTVIAPLDVRDDKTAYQDIKNTFGFVPAFLRAFPAVSIAGAWKGMRDFQLSENTLLSGKQKELIGLAVAAQIPCRYCVYFHTEAAKLNGATAQEIGETIAVASLTRHWSTILNGQGMDEKKFQQEIDKAFKFMEKRAATRVAKKQ